MKSQFGSATRIRHILRALSGNGPGNPQVSTAAARCATRSLPRKLAILLRYRLRPVAIQLDAPDYLSLLYLRLVLFVRALAVLLRISWASTRARVLGGQFWFHVQNARRATPERCRQMASNRGSFTNNSQRESSTTITEGLAIPCLIRSVR